MAKKKAAKAQRYPLERVRNIGIVAHIDAGKTTTTEQILYYTGKEHRIGTVDAGNTTTDYEQLEQEKGITIVSAAVTVHWTPAPLTEEPPEEVRINIIDTPGHIDFTAEVERSLSVLDGAVAIFCGVAGVQAQSETVWRQANTYAVPRIAYVNKLDRSGANFFEVLQDIEDRLEGMTPFAVQVPVGEEKEFRGVVDLVRMKAWLWEEGDPPPEPTLTEIPAEVAEEAALYREELIDRVTALDDALANEYLEAQEEGRELAPAALRAAIRRVTLARTGFPVLCGSSFRHKGVQPLLDAVAAYLPSPLDRPPVKGRVPRSKRKLDTELDAWDEGERPPSEKAPFCALAFKTVSSKTSDLVYLRVYSGLVTGSDQILNVNKGKKERLGQIHILHANRKERVEVAGAGDIVGVVGLRYTVTGDTLCAADKPIRLGSIHFPVPVVSMSVEPRSSGDKDKLADALACMAKDDPTFTVHVDKETNQTLISGMGELHLEIIAEKLRRDWKVEAKVGKPRVSYKATVRGTAEARHVHDVEIGGKRRYAEVRLRVERMEKAPGGVLVDIVAPPEEIPPEFHGAIEDAIRSRAYSVGDWGDPLIDTKVTVTGGAHDPQERDEGAFAAAASRALEEALAAAGLASLEPIMTLTVDVPEEFYGNIVQDLQGRRARVLSDTVIKDSRRIVAAVPLAEMFGYASDVRSKSQGRATPSLEPRDYAEVPEGKRPKLWD
ncbi:MAG: elongation factor G [Planctomycetota bacterium]|nr:MAG: elongation factor G [Planctomycetota bacterium]